MVGNYGQPVGPRSALFHTVLFHPLPCKITDFPAIFFHLSLFSAAQSIPLNIFILSSHLFFYQPLTVSCRIFTV